MNKGFSLIECMTVLAVLAILLVMAAPSFAGVAKSADLRAARDTYFAAVQMARTSAITSRRQVVLCASVDLSHCSQGSSQSSNQFIVFVDHNQDGVLGARDRLLTTGQARDVSVTSSRQRVLFQPSGAAAGYNQTMKFCQPGNVSGLSIVISNAGRTRMASAHCS
jgi:type IV fimbrial biogenesis protein FimT